MGCYKIQVERIGDVEQDRAASEQFNFRLGSGACGKQLLQLSQASAKFTFSCVDLDCGIRLVNRKTPSVHTESDYTA
jgi:hypothetical protein